jgi:tetratricopeptide (TPR) repeat protein
MNINNYELVIYAVLILTNCVIAYHWAMYGFFEGTLDPQKSKPVIIAAFIGMGTFILAGYMQREGVAKLELLAKENTLMAAICLFGPALVLMALVRLFFSRGGIPEYNRARAAVQYWTRTNLEQGHILEEKGALLRQFPRAIKALEYFDRAITAQKKGTVMRSASTKFSIVDQEPDYQGLYGGRCPACGFELRLPDSTSGVTGQCTMCGAMVTAKRIGQTIYVSAFGKSTKRTVLSVQNKINIATAYGEKALLLRMMNRLDDAKESIDEAQRFVENALTEATECDIGQIRGMRTLQSLIIFRAAEIAHVSGQKQKAWELYHQCLAIDESIGHTGDKELIEGLAAQL